ncbi:VWA domain-containing protein [Actinoplanes sp. NPDC049265]|uniref:VWA domain-containing protein n=1 Tax=Actinoplanes sp. NPDC049265 TaxID=3363902 RepID=UPI00371DD679
MDGSAEDEGATTSARTSRGRRRIALLTAPLLVLGAVVTWAAGRPAQAAPGDPVPYRVGYASADVPVLAAVTPGGPTGGVTLPAPDATTPAEDPGSRLGGLVFVTRRDGHRDHDLRYRAPGATSSVSVLADDFDDRDPQLSPDGTTIAFESDRSGQPDIWTIGVNGQGLRRITDHPGDDLTPSWSPTGDRLAFSSTRDDPAGDIYTVRVADKVVTRIAADKAADSQPAWAAPSGVIAFTTSRFATEDQPGAVISAIADGGTQVSRLVAGEEAAWSPDGQRLAFTVRTADPSGDIAVLNVLTGAVTQVRKNPGRAETHPAWNGAALIYSDVTVAEDDSADIWSADPAGLDRQDHTQRAGASETAPAYTRDGFRMAYAEERRPPGSESPGSSRIVVADAEGGNPQPLTAFADNRFDDDPSWSPDGSMIAFGRTLPNESRSVVVVRVENGAVIGTIPVPWRLRAADTKPAWSPDGTRIAFVRKQVQKPPHMVIPGPTDRRLYPGGSYTIDQLVKTPAILPTPDIMLLVDTTGSMGGVMQNVKDNLHAVINQVRQAQPKAQFGLAGFRDQSNPQDLFKLYSPITPDPQQVHDQVDKLSVAGRDDDPEDWGFALDKLSTDTPARWRANSNRIIVLVGDAPTHNPSNKKIKLSDAVDKLNSSSTRVVAADLGQMDLAVIGCTVSPCSQQATFVVKETGGQLVRTVNHDNVSRAILTPLRNERIVVTPTVGHCDAGLLVSFSPSTPTRVFSGTDVHYQQTVTIAPGLDPDTVLRCDVSYPIDPNPDGNQESYTAPVTVTVNDPALPLVTVDDVSVLAKDAYGTPVNYPASAVASDGTPLTPDCSPPASTTEPFPVGQTTVTCTAEDADGNVGQDTALIAVIDPGADNKSRIYTASLTAVLDGPVTFLDEIDISLNASVGCPAAVNDDAPAFAPDGNSVAFTADGRVCVTDPAGLLPRQFTPADSPRAEDPAFSPDGAVLAYTSVVPGEPSRRTLRTLPAAGGDPTVLVDTPGEAFEAAFRPLAAGLTLTLTAAPVQVSQGDSPIRLTAVATNTTNAPATRVWLSTLIPTKDPVVTSIGALAAGASTTVGIDVTTETAFTGTVQSTVSGLFPGGLPAIATASAAISVLPKNTVVTEQPKPTFTPTLTAEPKVGPPGFVTAAVGQGFKPGSTVTLTWEPGIKVPQRVKVGKDGRFRVQVLVFHRDQLGPRKLIAEGTDMDLREPKKVISADFLVVPGGQDPADFAVRR